MSSVLTAEAAALRAFADPANDAPDALGGLLAAPFPVVPDPAGLRLSLDGWRLEPPPEDAAACVASGASRVARVIGALRLTSGADERAQAVPLFALPWPDDAGLFVVAGQRLAPAAVRRRRSRDCGRPRRAPAGGARDGHPALRPQ